MAGVSADDIIEAIHAAGFDDEAFDRLPGVLAENLNGRAAGLQFLDRHANVREIVADHFPLEAFDRYVRALSQDDPPTALGTHMSGNLLVFADAAPALSDNPHDDQLRVHGRETWHCMGGRIETRYGHLIVGVLKGAGDHAFDDADIARLHALFPHLGRLHELRARLGMAEDRLRLSQGALDRIGTALLAVDRDRRILMSNSAAEGLLRARDGLQSNKGILYARHRKSLGQLGDIIMQATSGRSCSGAAMVARENAKSLRIIANPMAGRKALLVIDDQGPPGKADILSVLYDLSPSETELALALLRGQAPDDIAAGRGVRISTIRSQLSSLLRKTGTRRQGELIVNLARGLPLFQGDVR